MTVDSNRPQSTVLLGTNGPPFNRYIVRYHNVEPEDEPQSHRPPPSVLAKYVTTFFSGCDVIEWCLLGGLTLIVALYAIDYGLDLRRTKFQIHLALCTAATLMSIIHVAVQMTTVLRSDRKPVLYDHAAIGLLVETEFEEEANDSGKRCASLTTTDTEITFPVGLGVAAVLVNVLLLVAFYLGGVDLGWGVIQSVIFPVSTSVARMAARGRLYRELVKKDADVNRVVLMEAAHLMREQLLLFPDSSSGAMQSSDIATDSNAERYRHVCDNVRLFVTALRNSSCYSTRLTGLRLHHQQNDTSAIPQWDVGEQLDRQDADDVLETPIGGSVECRLVSVVTGKDKRDETTRKTVNQ